MDVIQSCTDLRECSPKNICRPYL